MASPFVGYWTGTVANWPWSCSGRLWIQVDPLPGKIGMAENDITHIAGCTLSLVIQSPVVCTDVGTNSLKCEPI
jgi:hypothetical protein